MNTVKDLLQPVGLIWIGLIAVAILALRKKAWGAGITAAGLAVLLFLAGASPYPARWLASLERPYDRPMNAQIPAADAVVMLGGTHAFAKRELVHLSVGNSSNRILTALELMRLGKSRNLVLGGSKYAYQGIYRPDSELILGWAAAWKLPVGQVYPLGICIDTHDEAVRTAELVAQKHWREVLLVTSAGHLRRAEAVFRKVGVKVIPVGCDFSGLATLEGTHTWYLVPRSDGLSLLGQRIYEEIGWWWYWWKGWI
ncbi:MAG TPA: YdcF family protein [Candidatus Limnocylindria bacterium]|nr:YdcF family protein [Candidatus Limnocylindria bacterium]